MKLTKVDLSNVKAGVDTGTTPPIIPAPPPGYQYCRYYRTCPSFNYRVCIFPINDIAPDTNHC